MEKNEKAITTDEPEVNYRGVKAMPFIIGKTVVFCIFFQNSYSWCVFCFVVSLTWFWIVLFGFRKWDFWEAGSHWHLGKSLGLSHYCLQHEKHHSYNYCQCLQWYHQLCYLTRSLPLWHILRSVQDTRIRISRVFSGIHLYLLDIWTKHIRST